MARALTSFPVRIERHPLGPRCYVLGARAHEWHVGLVALAAASALMAAGASNALLAAVAGFGGWLLAKDWHDLVPSKRDTAAWRLGIHRVPAALRHAPRGAAVPAVAGWLTGAVGALNVISALTPDLPGRFAVLSAYAGAHTILLAHALALPAGVALLVISPYLLRRRSRALHAAIALLVILGGLNLVKGLDLEEALAGWALAGFLVWARAAFYVQHERLTPRQTARAAGAPALVVTAAALAALLAELWAGPTIAMTVGFVVALAVARTVFRPLAAPSSPALPNERHEAHRLVRAHGSDTLSFFKLRRDLQHFIARDRRAFVSYRVHGGVLLCSGDPVGLDAALPDLLSDLCLFAEARGLKLGFVGAGERFRELATQAGLSSVYIGDEALVDTSAFTLEGRSIRKVRQSVNRLLKGGYSAELCRLRDLSDPQLDELEQVSERWRGGQPERGFSMAMDGVRGEHLENSWVVVARDAERATRGFLQFVPSYGSARASLSAMRADRDAQNGLTEFMIVRSIELLRAEDIAEISLNFAAFGRWLHSPLCRTEQLLGRFVSLANPFFQIESLYTFSAKFKPHWLPRYLLYEGAIGLPRVALAALWAEGQLPKPSVPRLLPRRRPPTMAPGCATQSLA